jgi:hypothetical protein
MRRRIILSAVAIGLFCFYLVALVYAIGVVTAWRVPAWWAAAFSTRDGSVLWWLFTSHLTAVLLVSLAFAWAIARIFGQFSLALSLIFALVIWGFFEAPLMLNAFRSDVFLPKGFWIADTVQLIAALPVLVLLFRRLPSNNRFERSRGASSVSQGGSR